MFAEEEYESLAKLVEAVPADVIQAARMHRGPGDPPPAGDAAALAKLEGGAEALLQFQQNKRPLALKWARHFAQRFVTEIRNVVCSKKDAKALGLTGTAVATTVAAWLTGLVGLTGPIALGIAGLIVLALGRTTIETFCLMTTEELKSALST